MPGRRWPELPCSVEQWRPGRVRREGGGRHRGVNLAGHVDHEQLAAALAARIAEEDEILPVGSPGRPLVVIALGERALSLAVRAHHADRETGAALLGKGDVVAARRPGWLRIGALAEGYAPGIGAVRAHDVDLLFAAAVALEHDLAPIGRE